MTFTAPAPAEVGLPGYAGPNPLSNPPTKHITEVHLTPAFDDGSEPSTESFIGTSATLPRFNVTRLLNPPRVAVDIY